MKTKFYLNQPVKSDMNGYGVVIGFHKDEPHVRFGTNLGTYTPDGRRAAGHPIDLHPVEVERPKPEPCQDAEEVLESAYKHHKKRIAFPDKVYQAMRTHAENEVAKAVEAKDKEIKELKDLIRGCTIGHDHYAGRCEQLISELSAAKQRISELEKLVEALKHIGH